MLCNIKLSLMKWFLKVVCIVFLFGGCGPKALVNPNQESFNFTNTVDYEKVITDDAITKQGLFKVHKVKDHYYFEIPDSLLARDILVVTRFIKTPAGAGNYGGEEIGEKTIYFEKGPANKIFLRIATFVSKADEND